MRAILSLGNVHHSTGNLQIPVSIISALAAFGAFVAFWAPAYLKILELLARHNSKLLGGCCSLSGPLAWPALFTLPGKICVIRYGVRRMDIDLILSREQRRGRV